MLELEAGPRQMSRVSGLSYGIIQHIKMDHGDRLFEVNSTNSFKNSICPLDFHIDFYAQRLFLSPRYMSTLVKQVSGKAAKQWIDDAIITRIKVELRHTNKSAAQIADEMNFPNPSFFCKYFKRMTGLTTQDYREGKMENAHGY